MAHKLLLKPEIIRVSLTGSVMTTLIFTHTFVRCKAIKFLGEITATTILGAGVSGKLTQVFGRQAGYSLVHEYFSVQHAYIYDHSRSCRPRSSCDLSAVHFC